MDVSDILDDLNEKQREAVSAPACNLLVLAGAGSGKTRVLVHRIAWLMRVEQVSPYSILAVTFTNKAAGEMRHRIESMLNMPVKNFWIGTFHGLAHRLLRTHYQEANLPENFQILDSDDQQRLIKRVIKSLDLDDEHWPARQAQWFINGKKDEGIKPEGLHPQGDPFVETMQRIYHAYEETCERSGLIDFAEILLRAFNMLKNNDELRKNYQERFKHILVDEFQDTNTIQYAWIKLLTTENNNVMAVGDDDQSIYGWRGAKIENIHRFEYEFKDTKVVRLEQNYRSTNTILKAANELIANNDDRYGKELWTAGSDGDAISIYAAFNEIDEAKFIVGQIQLWVEQGHCYKDTAILYRSNAQSRVIEEALIQARVPYRVYGGLRFFERAEIKDALAYLRLVSNRNDDAALERVINLPTRGIGDRTMQTLREIAKVESYSLWQAAMKVLKEESLPTRAHNSLANFMTLMDELSEHSQGMELPEQTEHVIHKSGLWHHYGKVKSEKARAKLENLEELINATKSFEHDPDLELPLLSQFLTHAALESGEEQASEYTDYVQLMTLHSAKGLEFPVVFMAGVEEGLFPHKMSHDEPGRLEEERRLCYVGMTRAMQKLFMTYAEIRRQYGTDEYHTPSRFIKELPAELLDNIRATQPSAGYSNQGSSKKSKASFLQSVEINESGLRLGQLVSHPKFGEGVVTNFEGNGAHARIQIQFAQHGTKWLVMSYANLTPA